MLSIDKCRELIDGAEKYTDEEIAEIRDNIYELADLAFDVWLAKKNKGS